jgi:diaminopimelate decarboxylase
MDHFTYRDGVLHAEDVAIPRIAAVVGTPFYCYSTATLTHHYRVFSGAFAGLPVRICYAVKANGNLSVIRTLAELGAGADVVSEGEMRRSLAAGVPAADIVFSGVGKTRDEIAAALDAGIGQFNIESEAELAVVAEIAAARGRTARIAIRVNPDVDAATHAKITTGKYENKFGVAWPAARALYAAAAAAPALDVVGVAVHIGSQIIDLAPFERAFTTAVAIVRTLREDGHDIRRLDLGGGLGIPYDSRIPPSPADYGAMVRRVTAGIDCELVLEPGRVIVGNAGLLVCRVIYGKETAGHAFVIVDAGMNDLIRPALYDAHHDIVPVSSGDDIASRRQVDIVGPICESGDVFARGRLMPPLVTDDLLAIRSAGAYGAVMASTYNARRLVPEVIVRGNEFAVVRHRPTFEEMLAAERLPPWQAATGTAVPTPSR